MATFGSEYSSGSGSFYQRKSKAELIESLRIFQKSLGRPSDPNYDVRLSEHRREESSRVQNVLNEIGEIKKELAFREQQKQARRERAEQREAARFQQQEERIRALEGRSTRTAGPVTDEVVNAANRALERYRQQMGIWTQSPVTAERLDLSWDHSGRHFYAYFYPATKKLDVWVETGHRTRTSRAIKGSEYERITASNSGIIVPSGYR